MEGYNTTIFAYGQSVSPTQGSGKTFTMLGPEEVTTALVNDLEVTPPSLQDKYGIIPRAIYQIFTHVRGGTKELTEFSIKCSYVEIYNEAVNDLLGDAKNLRIREFPRLGMCVIGMTEKCVSAPEEVLDTLSEGTKHRITAATEQNSRSSRSHSIFCISVDQKLLNGSTKSSKLNLVDLAGSEKVGKTHASGQQLKEAQNINLSLTTLGRCIKALAGGKGEHVPFRESKLTMILRESLGGNAKTTLLCTASQRTYHVEESLGTMKFAERAKKVTLRATSNVRQSPEELALVIDQLKAEVSLLRQQLQTQSGCSLPVEDYTDLSIRFAELKSQYVHLSETSEIEIERLRQREEQAVEQENGLIAQAEGAESLIVELQAENEDIRKLYEENVGKVGGLEREGEALREENGRLWEALEEAKGRVEVGEVEKGGLQELNARLEKALNEANGRLGAFEERISLSQAENDRIVCANLRLSASLSAAKEEIVRVNSNLLDTEQQRNSLNTQLEATNARLQAQSAQLQAARLSLSHLTASLSAAELAKAQADSSAAAMSAHFRLLQSDEGAVCDLTQSRGSNAKAGKTRVAVAKLLQELKDLKAGVDAAGLQHQSELLALRQASEERQLRLEDSLRSSQIALEEERGRGEALLQTLRVMTVELETAHFSLKQTKLQLLTTQSSLQTELSARKALEETLDRLKLNCSSLKKDASEARAQLLETQQSCAAALNQSEREVEQLQEEKAAAEADLLDREAELRDLDSLVKGLESQLSVEQERNRQLALTKVKPTEKGAAEPRARGSKRSHTSWGEKCGFSLQDVQSLYSLDEEAEADVNLGSLEEVTLSEESEHSDGQKAVHCID